MLIGGLWTWVADSDNVISAMESLSSAEQDLADAQSDASFNADKANWEGYISSIDNQIGAIDALVYTMDDLATEIHDLVDGVQTQIQMALSASTTSLFSSLPNYTGTSNALFNTANLQNLWTASVNNAIAGSGQTISTNTLIGELLANMASYGSAAPPATNNGDVLMWNGNVVAQGNDVTALINILRSLVPIFPVDN
jgi:prophage DNA circulation protein